MSHRADADIVLLTASIVEAGKAFAVELEPPKHTEEFRNTPVSSERYSEIKITEISICLEHVCFMLHFATRVMSGKSRTHGDIMHARMSSDIIDIFSSYFTDVFDENIRTVRSLVTERINATEQIYSKKMLVSDPMKPSDIFQTVVFAAAKEICNLAGRDRTSRNQVVIAAVGEDFLGMSDEVAYHPIVAKRLSNEISTLKLIERTLAIHDKLSNKSSEVP